MPWFRSDDKFGQHPKVMAIPKKDRLLTVGAWYLAAIWCASNSTDGRLPGFMIEELDVPKRAVDHLTRVGLWVRDLEGGFIFHDWLDYNPSRKDVMAKQEGVSKVRSEAGRKGAAARWGTPLEAPQATDEEWQTDLDANSKPIANGMANAWQTDSVASWQNVAPDPTRPDPTRTDPNNQTQTPSTPAPRDVVDPDLEALFNQPSPPPPPAAPKYPAAFEEFWNVYPRRVGKDAALKAWRNATRRAGPDVLAGAVRYRDDPHRPTDKNYIPHPATWLNAGRWSDEPCSPPMADARPVKQTRTTTILNDAAERIARYREQEATDAAQAANIHHQRIGP